LAVVHVDGCDMLDAERDLIYGLAGLIRKVFSKSNTVTVRDATVMAVAARAF
jgi:hypothetical protein